MSRRCNRNGTVTSCGTIWSECYRPSPQCRWGGEGVKVLRTIVAIALWSSVAGGTGWAQAVAGSQISGVVRDSSGGAIPGAEVTVTKTDTGTMRTVFTG